MKRVLHPPRFRSILHQKAISNLRHSRLIWITLFLFPASWSLRPLFPRAGVDKVEIERRITPIIEEFSERLGITQHVIVTVVTSDPRLASVKHISGGAFEYQISFKAEFLRTLDNRELSAAVAHELGHVWIYTHFPYLQTEELANEVALRLVPRSDLARVYEKAWMWDGGNGSIEKALRDVDEIHSRHDSK